MTTEEIIALAKEKFGKDIKEQEALDYLSGKLPLPDEALELVSGGGSCGEKIWCPRCHYRAAEKNEQGFQYYCYNCGIRFNMVKVDSQTKWQVSFTCPKCNRKSYYEVYDNWSVRTRCRYCGYEFLSISKI